MTDEARAGEPRTSTGRMMLEADWTYRNVNTDELRRAILAIERESAAEWRRKYEGMVKERDDQIYRKRESRRILTERSTPAAAAPSLDVEGLARAMETFMRRPPNWQVAKVNKQDRARAWESFYRLAHNVAAEYRRLSESAPPVAPLGEDR